MRGEEQAPVDTMGCGVEMKKNVSKEENSYHTLISLMLSAQTKDEVTFTTTKYMVDEHKLSVKVILDTPVTTLNQWISNVGFNNKKAIYIKEATKIISEKH